ncbi:hypothetical protein A1F94_013399 [Pyrenophora tritici-repentis]|uniref:Uncharacterized protein n=1 Tax=Pyrenophora tritici-repentis TaxID=45151 RepID=A0A5M9L6R7_9PLEO|nr:hypothetical protein PtrV1_05419 [Pyrenophora tritici-repentis]KAF7450162.1 hypothetical protein A1F99_047780 [Pyrenophora tritici-repentis]KAF7572731.1 hypothetical protein PtrM4_076360 [Pyrenophora tritici-repentis]KAG9376133.1 hypothetical protein A1F94_013399 [Pyrenophora tritici-repentis]KAI0587361.1 hypothetical protein Alg215_01429 [Pyrenophora tritici-repentis]
MDFENSGMSTVIAPSCNSEHEYQLEDKMNALVPAESSS